MPEPRDGLSCCNAPRAANWILADV
eukprot:COSAG01_NODE_41540_length_450_cov_0.917379_1_plen_24_part_01